MRRDDKNLSWRRDLNRIKAVDFFCGAGGVTRGFLNAGIDVLYGIDIDESARATYEKNNVRKDGSHVPFIAADIRTVTPDRFGELTEERRDFRLIFAACPPCQYFSKVNTEKKNRMGDSNLFLVFAELVAAFRPDFIFAENVLGIKYDKYGSIAAKFVETLKQIGYEIVVRPVDAKNYGVPQNRQRMIFLAALRGSPGFPKETHSRGNYATVRDAIGDRSLFPKLNAGQADSNVPNHRASALSQINTERIRRTPPNGGGRLTWSHIRRLKLKCYQNHSGHTDVYGRMKWDAPAPTLTTRFNSLSNGRFGHPKDHRAISLREGAALQTFPYDYFFYGIQAQIARHIGNAVPVRIAEIFGQHILTQLRLF